MTPKYILNTLVGALFVSLLTTFPSEAQVRHDLTLPNNTNIKIEGNKITIDGGTQVGKNLFHSFQDFSLSKGDIAAFNNALDIGNIIVRVTGASASNINGIITGKGTANVFFDNPNGISFGKDARLNIGGSFLATTASGFMFPNGSEFSATNPQAPPLLAINVPIGLRFGSNPGAIQVTGEGNKITPSFSFSPTKVDNNLAGLTVQPGKNLALIGNNINLEGSTISASGGSIELGSVASGLVGLESTPNGWAFSYKGVSNFSDIQLSKEALVNASGTGSGSIELNATNVKLSDASLFLIQNRGTIPSGSLAINASESLILKGTSIDGNASSAIRSETVSAGKGSNITIFTPKLVLQDGGRIGASTYSDGKGGNVAINAPNSVQLLENTSINTSRQTFTVSSIAATTYGSGDAGNLQISTKDLRVTNGGSVTSTTIGSGNGGDVNINSDIVEIVGMELESKRSSTISAASAKSGQAGDLTINASQLHLRDGGLVSTSSFDTGAVGNLTVNASEIEVSGIKNGVITAIRASVDSLANSDKDQQRLGFSSVPNGSPGQMVLNAKSININQGGLVTVRNQGTQEAGKLEINAESIKLNEGSITATTSLGEGGNISIGSQDLQLRFGSVITATAGNSGNGGNIAVKADTVTLLEGSGITANAFEGRGGKIVIDAQGLFVSSDSMITTNSVKGVNGTVTINTQNINLLQTVLPKTAFNLPSSSKLCASSEEGENQFINAGTGGIPASPSDPFDSLDGWSDDRKPDATTSQEKPSAPLTQTEVTEKYTEAQGWKNNADGTISFTDIPSQINAKGSLSSAPCHNSEESLAQTEQPPEKGN
ncbi:MAG: filamentous hemagglutinin N-terminal domain-containing protein [Nostoc sp.]|uniref:two-partner secretion domain-containing protein n=1 Tax=Nostoc sp. TaxID=1180 RepID=UPI002FFC1250